MFSAFIVEHLKFPTRIAVSIVAKNLLGIFAPYVCFTITTLQKTYIIVKSVAFVVWA